MQASFFFVAIARCLCPLLPLAGEGIFRCLLPGAGGNLTHGDEQDASDGVAVAKHRSAGALHDPADQCHTSRMNMAGMDHDMGNM